MSDSTQNDSAQNHSPSSLDEHINLTISALESARQLLSSLLSTYEGELSLTIQESARSLLSQLPEDVTSSLSQAAPPSSDENQAEQEEEEEEEELAEPLEIVEALNPGAPVPPTATLTFRNVFGRHEEIPQISYHEANPLPHSFTPSYSEPRIGSALFNFNIMILETETEESEQPEQPEGPPDVRITFTPDPRFSAEPGETLEIFSNGRLNAREAVPEDVPRIVPLGRVNTERAPPTENPSGMGSTLRHIDEPPRLPSTSSSDPSSSSGRPRGGPLRRTYSFYGEEELDNFSENWGHHSWGPLTSSTPAAESQDSASSLSGSSSSPSFSGRYAYDGVSLTRSGAFYGEHVLGRQETMGPLYGAPPAYSSASTSAEESQESSSASASSSSTSSSLPSYSLSNADTSAPSGRPALRGVRFPSWGTFDAGRDYNPSESRAPLSAAPLASSSTSSTAAAESQASSSSSPSSSSPSDSSSSSSPSDSWSSSSPSSRTSLTLSSPSSNDDAASTRSSSSAKRRRDDDDDQAASGSPRPTQRARVGDVPQTAEFYRPAQRARVGDIPQTAGTSRSAQRARGDDTQANGADAPAAPSTGIPVLDNVLKGLKDAMKRV